MNMQKARDEFGFTRMWSIYSTQVQAIVDAMKPDFTELDAAQNILIKAQDNEWANTIRWRISR